MSWPTNPFPDSSNFYQAMNPLLRVVLHLKTSGVCLFDNIQIDLQQCLRFRKQVIANIGTVTTGGQLDQAEFQPGPKDRAVPTQSLCHHRSYECGMPAWC